MPIPLSVILFLIFAIILPLALIVIGLVFWPHLPKWLKALVILLAVFVLAASFLAPGFLAP